MKASACDGRNTIDTSPRLRIDHTYDTAVYVDLNIRYGADTFALSSRIPNPTRTDHFKESATSTKRTDDGIPMKWAVHMTNKQTKHAGIPPLRDSHIHEAIKARKQPRRQCCEVVV